MSLNRLLLTTIIVIIISFFTFLIVHFYLSLYDNPYEKYRFRQKTINYVKEKYPELQIEDVSVKYEFKEMYYYSLITAKSGVNFQVKMENNHLKDNYYSSIWMTRVSKEVKGFVEKEISSDVSFDFIINTNEKK